MINLTDRAATAQEAAPGGTAPEQQNTGAADSGAPGSAAPAPAAAPTGKPAPATINGVNVPAGGTLVEDPELIRQILDATRKR